MKRPNIGWFAANIIGKPLYPFQVEIGNAILDSVLNNRGLTFTIMLARQMGKNQISAIIETYLLSCMEEGNIIKAAPTYKPQVINSRLRLLSMLENPLTGNRVWRSFGYMIGVARSKQEVREQTGPRVMFFSANPDSSIVGATASLLLEVDEAQDVAIDKFDRDLRPMASTTNSTTVLCGTAWTDDTLLAIVRANNLELEQQDSIKRHFEYDWRTLAAINPHYKRFVEAEIARLGEDHLTIRTQYYLQPISGAGFLLSDMQRYLLQGSHDWEDQPNDEGDAYLLGMDVGGEGRPKVGDEKKLSVKRDSTIITVGRVSYNELDLPKVEIVHQYWFTGIDERITAFKFSRPSKSKLTYQFLSMINSGRLKMYRADQAPAAVHHEAWMQLRLARYRVPGEGLIDMFVPVGEGHDDFLMSIALCGEATREFAAPVQESLIVRPRRLYEGEERY